MKNHLKNPKQKLLIDWATFEQSTFACKNWHYSKCMPTGKTVKIGVWEADKFIGVVIYSYGANNNAAKSFGLQQHEVCELTRVALAKHQTETSKILSISLKLLAKHCPGLRLIFSYADKTNQGHHGGIYQANGWLYIGERTTSDKGAYYYIHGKKIHGRSARAKYGKEINFPQPWCHAPSETKHLYVKLLDKKYVLKFPTLKYPKRRVSSVEADTSPFQGEMGGASPTDTLQSAAEVRHG